MGGGRHVCKILCGNLIEETRWETHICSKIMVKWMQKIDCNDVNWVELAYDGVQWFDVCQCSDELLWSMTMWILLTIWRHFLVVSFLWDRFFFEHFGFPVPVFIPPVMHTCYSTKQFCLAQFLQLCWISEGYSELS